MGIVRPDSHIAICTSTSRCQVCDEKHPLAMLSCGHRACLLCWTRWINGRLDLCHGNPCTVQCWGYRCQVDVPDWLWEMLAALVTVPLQDDLDTHGITLLLRRRKLQMNSLFPPSMQVDCRRPSCFGLGYAGSDTVMCFFCEEQ